MAGLRPVDLAREHGLSAQAIRNYERDGFLPPAARTHTVVKGDTLSKLAKQYYGSAGQWKRIYEANKDTIENPDLIYPGQTVKIP